MTYDFKNYPLLSPEPWELKPIDQACLDLIYRYFIVYRTTPTVRELRERLQEVSNSKIERSLERLNEHGFINLNRADNRSGYIRLRPDRPDPSNQDTIRFQAVLEEILFKVKSHIPSELFQTLCEEFEDYRNSSPHFNHADQRRDSTIDDSDSKEDRDPTSNSGTPKYNFVQRVPEVSSD